MGFQDYERSKVAEYQSMANKNPILDLDVFRHNMQSLSDVCGLDLCVLDRKPYIEVKGVHKLVHPTLSGEDQSFGYSIRVKSLYGYLSLDGAAIVLKIGTGINVFVAYHNASSAVVMFSIKESSAKYVDKFLSPHYSFEEFLEEGLIELIPNTGRLIDLYSKDVFITDELWVVLDNLTTYNEV